MYLDERKLKKSLSTAKTQMIVGVIFVVIMGYGIIDGILNNSELRQHLTIYVVLILPFIWMILLSVQNKKRVENARRLNQFFYSDADGFIRPSDLINVLGSKSESEATKTVSQLIGKGLLRNCTIEHQPYTRIVLSAGRAYGTGGGSGENGVYGNDAARGANGTIVSVKCPNCGARVEKRLGFTSTCPYCDTKIS